MLQPAILLLLIVLGIGLFWLWSDARRCTRQFAALAHRLRLKFTVRDTIGLGEKLCAIHIHHQGHSQRFCNIIHGRHGNRRVFIGEIRYETGAGGVRNSRRFTFAAGMLRLPDKQDLHLPQMAAFADDSFRPISRFQYFLPFHSGRKNIDPIWKLYSDHPDIAARLWLLDTPDTPNTNPPVSLEFYAPYVVMYVEDPLNGIAAAQLLKRTLRWVRYFEKQIN